MTSKIGRDSEVNHIHLGMNIIKFDVNLHIDSTLRGGGKNRTGNLTTEVRRNNKVICGHGHTVFPEKRWYRVKIIVYGL